MADDTIEVMDSEAINHAHVIGASMGGAVAQTRAVLRPDRVRSRTPPCTPVQRHARDRDITPGSVVIDLIGGSPYRRSPVEHFQWTTFLPEIHHEYNGHYYAGLWGWDMFYSMTETAKEYSRRIKDVLTGNGDYATDLDRFFTDYAYAAQLGL